MGLIDDNARQLRYAVKTVWPVDMGIGEDFISYANAGPVLGASLDASEQRGMPMTTADEVYGEIDLVEWDFDASRDILAQVVWTQVGASESGIIWGLDVNGRAVGEAEVDCKVTNDGSITFAAATTVTAAGWYKTEMKALNVAGTFADSDGILSDEVMEFALTMDNDGTGGADEAILKFIRFFGTRKLDGPLNVAQQT